MLSFHINDNFVFRTEPELHDSIPRFQFVFEPVRIGGPVRLRNEPVRVVKNLFDNFVVVLFATVKLTVLHHRPHVMSMHWVTQGSQYHSPYLQYRNGGRAHYVMVSKTQWKPFWLAILLFRQNGWAQLHFVNCDVCVPTQF